MKLFQGNNYQVIYDADSPDLQHALELLEQSNKRLVVTYEDRKAFLTPFVHLLVDKNKEHGLRGVSRLSRVLHLLVDFMDADGSGNTLNAKCIEDELYRIHVELYTDH